MKKITWVSLIIMFLACSKSEKPHFFGKYCKPVLLQKLEDYQESGKANWEELWFYIKYDRPYSMTPLDVIPFAYTGLGGLHFGFLTDFGTVDNLENAPIVSISPSDDPAIRFIAPNLETFLSYVCYTKNASLLTGQYKNEEALVQSRTEDLENSDSAFLTRLESTIEILHNELEIPKIDADLVSTMQNDKKVRKTLDTFETYDGIGIQIPNSESITEFSYSKDLTEIDDFLKSSNRSSRIVFYRNASLAYILGKEYSPKVTSKIIEYLKKDGFSNEVSLLRMLK